jgi:hypothetical protein
LKHPISNIEEITLMSKFLISLLLAAMPITSSADFPWARGKAAQVTMTIRHDAQVKTPLQQLAFAEPEGKCADLLTDALVADFAGSGATVIDRINFKRIMSEHRLNLGGAIDEKTAAKIGRLIGAGSLVFVKVHDCSTYKTKEIRNSLNGLGVKRTQVPTTRGTMKASIQIVNLTTGVTSAARLIDAKASISADQMDTSKVERAKDAAVSFLTGAKEYSEYPADEDVQTALFGNAVEQVHHLLFPWTETKQFIFFDDSQCSLQVAYELMQKGDYDGAVREAQISLETCKTTSSVKPTTMAHAYYNRAMTAYMTDHFDSALDDLRQAARLETTKVVTDAITMCNLARVASLGKPETKAGHGTVQPSSAPIEKSTEKKLTPEERLKRLDDLHKRKVISDDEYERRRKEILAEL